jgi:hypothetical protein
MYLLTYLISYSLTYLCTYLLTYLLTQSLTHSLTYLLTLWSRVLLEKLNRFSASEVIPRIFGTPRFITAFTSVSQLSPS